MIKSSYRKSILMIIALVFTVSFLESKQSFATERSEIELVESIPIETSLDMENLRNTLEVWQEMIVSAKTSVDIETFYVSTREGEPLDIILSEIKRAASRGVKVRIISEEKFRKTYPEPLTSLAKVENIEVRFIDFGKIAGGVMHAKYFIVDGKQVFLGSQNFDWRALKHIHELGIRVKHESISEIFIKLFNTDWEIAKENIISNGLLNRLKYEVPISLVLQDRSVPVIPVFSPQNFLPYENLWDEPRIIELIDGAKKKVNIQLLTYSPANWDRTYYEVLDNALRRAGVRGVKIRLLCSDWSKRHPRIDFLKSLSHVPNIEVKLSTIPEYSGGFIPYARVEHCKYLVVDGERFWIGTSNWSKDYFHNGRNVGLIIDDKILGETIQAFFYNSWNSAYAYFIDPCKEYEPPKVKGEE